MKRHQIRLILMVFMLFTSLLLLLGCSSKTPEKKDPPASAPASNPVAPSPSEPPKTTDDKAQLMDLIQKGQLNREMSYELVITGAGLSSESKVWFKEKKLKADTIMNGQRTISIFDISKAEILTYLPDQKMATKIKYDEYQGLDNITPTDYLPELDKENIILAGSATVNGMSCKVILLSHGDNQVKLWISTEYGLVVKIEDKMNTLTTTIEFRRIKLGLGTVPENTFTLPAGIEIVDLNQMMQGSPSAGNP